jgi:hypothetical protein
MDEFDRDWRAAWARLVETGKDHVTIVERREGPFTEAEQAFREQGLPVGRRGPDDADVYAAIARAATSLFALEAEWGRAGPELEGPREKCLYRCARAWWQVQGRGEEVAEAAPFEVCSRLTHAMLNALLMLALERRYAERGG